MGARRWGWAGARVPADTPYEYLVNNDSKGSSSTRTNNNNNIKVMYNTENMH